MWWRWLRKTFQLKTWRRERCEGKNRSAKKTSFSRYFFPAISLNSGLDISTWRRWKKKGGERCVGEHHTGSRGGGCGEMDRKQQQRKTTDFFCHPPRLRCTFVSSCILSDGNKWGNSILRQLMLRNAGDGCCQSEGETFSDFIFSLKASSSDGLVIWEGGVSSARPSFKNVRQKGVSCFPPQTVSLLVLQTGSRF